MPWARSVMAMPAGMEPKTIRDLECHRWPVTATFVTRLAALRELIQECIDQLPDDNYLYIGRFRATARLSLDDLAVILPPAEKRLLAHLRARKPLGELLGRPGFPSIRRRNRLLQLLLSRVKYYVGSHARHRLMQPYDRVGHYHRRRTGRPRKVLPEERMPSLHFWVPLWLALKPPPGMRIIEELPGH